MIYSKVPAILLKTPVLVSTLINQEIESNTSLALVHNNCNLSVKFSSVLKHHAQGIYVTTRA